MTHGQGALEVVPGLIITSNSKSLTPILTVQPVSTSQQLNSIRPPVHAAQTAPTGIRRRVRKFCLQVQGVPVEYDVVETKVNSGASLSDAEPAVNISRTHLKRKRSITEVAKVSPTELQDAALKVNLRTM